jgi:hypothetical protein
MKKTKVTLRTKAIANGKLSFIWTSILPISIRRPVNIRVGILKLYLFVKPKNVIEKINNTECQKTAELICIRRQNEMCKNDIYTPFELEQLRIKEIGDKSFLEYFKKQADKRYGNNQKIWFSAILHFTDFLESCDFF